MKELVEAAVETAARLGVMASVVIVDGKNGDGGITAQLKEKLIATENELAAMKVGNDADRLKKRIEETSEMAHKAIARATKAEQALDKIQREKETGVFAPGVGPQELEAAKSDVAVLKANLEAAKNQREELEKVVSTVSPLKAEIADLKKQLKKKLEAPAAPAPVSQPIEVGPIYEQDIKILGLESKHDRKFKKLGWDTIGKLRKAFLAGEVRTKAGLKKDDVIGVGEKLINVPISAPAKVVTTEKEASTAPGGVVPRSWMQVLSAAKKKWEEVRVCQADMDRLESEKASPDADADVLAKKIADFKEQRDVYYAQVLAFMWAMGLDHRAEDLNTALASAGLSDLI